MRSPNRSFCLLALTVLLTLSFSPRQQATNQAPGNWRTATPESQGVDSAMLAEAIETARQRGLAIHSFLLIRNGRLIAESYFYPYDGKTPHDIASVTKPITATLIGLAIAQGKIESVKQPMLSLFAGRNVANVDERKQRVAVEHLLTMSSGLACKAQAGEPTLWEMLSAADNTQFMLDLPMVADPGSNYVYCSGGMHLLSSALKQRTGMNAEAFARKNLFAPLGITNLIWPRDAQQVSHGFGNLHLLPRDMAKLGQLFLDGGRWQGKQIIPADWLKEATRSHIKTGGAGTSDYGYGWRVPTNGGAVAFEAGGRGGQQISVLPSKNAVVVFNGGGFSSGDFMKQVLAAFKSDQALPENPAALARLNAAIAAVAKAPAPQAIAALPSVAQTISGKTFELEKNWLGLKTLSLSFRAGGATATATLQFQPALKQYQWGLSAKVRGDKTVTETRAVGLDGVPRFSSDGIVGLPVALKGNWQSDGSFVLEYDEVANTNTHRLQLTFDGNRVKVAAKERTGLFNETFSGQMH
ncbi:MAG TPA: serine hydrolase [Blastocatellia bacterium]|nr:serine hydrolase [Blastocatellia bacterium]HMZ17516.1 serine hydrolase [Blastocatellia bacterium]HNG31361.1 serine hydrolase [Blastocatellia bacterium]